MAIGFRAAGTTREAATQSGSVTLPSGWQAGDLHVMCVTVKESSATINTPSGFTAPTNGETTGGTGALGVDSGTVKVAVFYREAQAGDGNPTLSTGAAPDSIQAFILGFTKDAAETWETPLVCANASDTTGSTTSYGTVTGNATIDLAAGDWAGQHTGFNGDAGTPGTRTLTWGGVTLGAYSAQVANNPCTAGNDVMSDAGTAAYSSGTASSAPTLARTWTSAAANFSGATIFFRLRVSTAPPNEGTASGSWSFTGAAAGARTPVATGSSSWAFTGAAAGVRTPVATGSGTWSFAGAAAGVRAPVGTATGGWTITGAAAGTTARSGSAAGSSSFTGAAVGDAPANQGSATGSWSFTGAAAGAEAPVGAATGSWSFTGAAAGAKAPVATGTGSWNLAGAAAGTTTRSGSASGAWSFAGTATGARAPQSVATGTWSFSGVVFGGDIRTGFAAGTWSFAGAATGVRAPQSTAVGATSYAGAAAGITIRSGSASGERLSFGIALGRTAHSGSGSGAWQYVGAASSTQRGSATGTWQHAGAAFGFAPLLSPVLYTATPVLVSSVQGANPAPNGMARSGAPAIAPGTRAGAPVPA